MTRSRTLLVCVVIGLGGCASRTSLSTGNVLSVSTFDFVVSALTVEATASATRSGFNLDSAFTTASDTTGCGVPDRPSAIDLDQNASGCAPSSSSCTGGVDNQLPLLLDELDGFPAPGDGRPTYRENLSTWLAGGRITTLLRVSGVESLEDDEAVQVALFRGYPNGDCAHLFDGTGHYLVTSDSVDGELTDPRWIGSGSIVDGRLRAVLPMIDDLAGFPDGPLPVSQFTVRVDLASDGSEGSQGNAGGIVESNALGDFLWARLPIWGGVIHPLMAELVDLPATDDTCGGFWLEFAGSISSGIAFSLEAAVLDGVATVRPAGTCGSN